MENKSLIHLPEGRGSAYLWDKEAGWSDQWGAWGMVIRNKKQMRSLSFWAGAAKLQVLHVQKLAGLACCKGGILAPLMSKVIDWTLSHAQVRG